MQTSEQMQRMAKARSALVLDHPWFGVLSLRLGLVEQPGIGTMRTDGTVIEFDPVATAKWTDAEVAGVLAHEVMHCALRHMYRANGRDMKMWNTACDHAINPLLRKDGFKLPEGMLDDSRFHGLSAEAIYAKLESEKPDDQQSGSGQGQGDQPGGFTPPKPDAKPDPNGKPDNQQQPGQPEPEAMSETDWQVAVEQATAIATKRGHVSGDVARMIASNRQSTTDWRDVLREFVQQVVPADYSWQRPNRRFIGAGVYLPGVVREGLPRIAVGVDTSGSINQKMLEAFAAELDAVLHQCMPEAMDVIYCDSSVKASQTFTPDHTLTADTLTPKGGGGTRFQPVFDHVAEQDAAPVALIYLTDLDGDKPKEPDYPVLWVTPSWVKREAPFGQTVKIN